MLGESIQPPAEFCCVSSLTGPSQNPWEASGAHLLVKREKVTCPRSHPKIMAMPALDLGSFCHQLGLF